MSIKYLVSNSIPERMAFIKEGKDASPVVNVKEELSEISKKNLEETLALEINIYPHL